MSDHDYFTDDRRAEPQPLTEEQMAFFTAQTERAVHKAVRRTRNGAVAGFLILLVGLGAAFRAQAHDQQVARDAIVKSGTVVAVDGCNGRFHDRQSLRSLFERLQDAVKEQAKQKHIPESNPEVQFALKFYRDELHRLPLPDCRPTAKILTDSPFPPVKIPAPLHP